MVHTLKLMLAVVCTFVFTTAALAKEWSWSGEIRTFQSGQILELLQQEAHDRVVAQAATERTGTFGAWEWAKAPVGLKRWITPHTRSVINSLEVELPEGVSTLPRKQLLNLFLAETYLLRVAFSDLDPRQGRLALDEVKPGDELFLLSPNADQARLESQIAAWLEERERRRQEAEPITLGEARQLVEEMLAEMDADDLTGLDFRAVIRAELEALQEEGQLTSVDLEDATNEALFGDGAPAGLTPEAITTALTSVRERVSKLEERMDQAEADIRDHEQRLNNLEDVNLPQEVRSILTELDLIDADGQPIRGGGVTLSPTQTTALTWVADLQRADGSFPEFVTTTQWDELQEELAQYQTEAEVQALLADYVTTEALNDYATKDDLSQATSWRGYTLWQWLLLLAAIVGLSLVGLLWLLWRSRADRARLDDPQQGLKATFAKAVLAEQQAKGAGKAAEKATVLAGKAMATAKAMLNLNLPDGWVLIGDLPSEEVVKNLKDGEEIELTFGKFDDAGQQVDTRVARFICRANQFEDQNGHRTVDGLEPVGFTTRPRPIAKRVGAMVGKVRKGLNGNQFKGVVDQANQAA